MSGPTPQNRDQRRRERFARRAPTDIQRRTPLFIGRLRAVLGIRPWHPWRSWPLRRIARTDPDSITITARTPYGSGSYRSRRHHAEVEAARKTDTARQDLQAIQRRLHRMGLEP